jgi:murein DD-endopeptidase MepM/ murein hydrolase activator NlpD
MQPVYILYAHLDKVMVKKGDTIDKGQQIGTVGNTCFSRRDPYKACKGAHLHFEVRSKQYLPTEDGRLDPVVFLSQYGQISPTGLMAIKEEEKQRDKTVTIGSIAAIAAIGFLAWRWVKK